MLPSEVFLAVLTFAVRASCTNDFVSTGDNAFPSEFSLNTETTFYWENLSGYIYGIRVAATSGRHDEDDNWILTPQCSGDTCTGYTNNGSASFGGSLAVDASGTQFTVGSGYTIYLLWTANQTYDDSEDSTSSVISPGFSIVSTSSDSSSGSAGLSSGAKAGIAVAVVLVVFFFIGVLWMYWRRKRRNKRRSRRSRDEENQKTGKKSWAKRHSGKIPTAAAVASKEPGKGKMYLDDKVELPTQGNSHELPVGQTPVPRISVISPQQAPVELPASPLQHSTPEVTASATQPVFQYNSRPSYALPTPTSPGGVSDISSPDDGPEDSGNAASVSPVSPIARKPVGGGSVMITRGSGDDSPTYTEVVPSRGKSRLLKKEKSRIWKMLGGGSLHDKLKPSSGPSTHYMPV